MLGWIERWNLVKKMYEGSAADNRADKMGQMKMNKMAKGKAKSGSGKKKPMMKKKAK